MGGDATNIAVGVMTGGLYTVAKKIFYDIPKEQMELQKDAQKQAKAAAATQERKAEEAMNAANKKQPDTMAILSAAQQAAKGGASGTMLTGPQGVNPSQLSLGKTSLLGG